MICYSGTLVRQNTGIFGILVFSVF